MDGGLVSVIPRGARKLARVINELLGVRLDLYYRVIWGCKELVCIAREMAKFMLSLGVRVFVEF